MKRTFIVVVGTLVLFQLVLAQAPPRAPKPGPEHKRMAYFAGNWTVEGEMKASPFGPGGKFTGADHNEMLGGFFLVLHSQGKGPMGDMKSLAVMGYDRDNKAYFYNEYASAGHMESAKGSITGDTWTWNSEEKMGAKIVNLSQGSSVFEQDVYTAIQNSGLLFTISAGNRGTGAYGFPASFDLPRRKIEPRARE